jgi:hypothetical protein
MLNFQCKSEIVKGYASLFRFTFYIQGSTFYIKVSSHCLYSRPIPHGNFTLLLFNCSPVQLFPCSTVLPVQLFLCSNVLPVQLFPCSTVLPVQLFLCSTVPLFNCSPVQLFSVQLFSCSQFNCSPVHSVSFFIIIINTHVKLGINLGVVATKPFKTHSDISF